MNTDDLRTLYGKQVHFNCQSGDEAFTDDYVLWLEKHLMEQSEGEQLGSEMEPYNTGG